MEGEFYCDICDISCADRGAFNRHCGSLIHGQKAAAVQTELDDNQGSVPDEPEFNNDFDMHAVDKQGQKRFMDKEEVPVSKPGIQKRQRTKQITSTETRVIPAQDEQTHHADTDLQNQLRIEMELWESNYEIDLNLMAGLKRDVDSHILCQVCNTKASSNNVFISHITGGKHKKKLKHRGLMTVPDDIIAAARGVTKSTIQKYIDPINSPIIGLDYVTEYQSTNVMEESTFACTLCTVDLISDAVIPHVLSFNHRLNYMYEHYPGNANDVVSCTSHAEQVQSAERYAQTIEIANGRQKISVLVDDNKPRSNKQALTHQKQSTGPPKSVPSTFLNEKIKLTIDGAKVDFAQRTIPIKSDTEADALMMMCSAVMQSLVSYRSGDADDRDGYSAQTASNPRGAQRGGGEYFVDHTPGTTRSSNRSNYTAERSGTARTSTRADPMDRQRYSSDNHVDQARQLSRRSTYASQYGRDNVPDNRLSRSRVRDDDDWSVRPQMQVRREVTRSVETRSVAAPHSGASQDQANSEGKSKKQQATVGLFNKFCSLLEAVASHDDQDDIDTESSAPDGGKLTSSSADRYETQTHEGREVYEKRRRGSSPVFEGYSSMH